MNLKAMAVTLCLTPLLFGANETERLKPVENVLNQIIEVPIVTKENQEQFCMDFKSNQDSLKSKNPHLAHLVKFSKEIYEKNCLGNKDNDEPSSFPDVPSSSLIWNDDPQCKLNDPRVRTCEFKHFNEKGIFIYKDEEYQNYLVCSTAHGSRNGLFKDKYFIDSKCLVSEVNWDSYTDNSVYDHSNATLYEAEVFLKWYNTGSKYAPIQIPNLLSKQCAAAFPNAKFCIPTLMILPTDNPHVFDECHLSTKKQRVDILFIHFSEKHSKWKCKTLDLRTVKVEDQHKSKSCVPTPAGIVRNSRNPHSTTTDGSVSSSCKLPYIPQTY